MAREVLYHEGRFKVEFDPERDGHWLSIGQKGYFLDRGILEELAITEPKDLWSKLNAVNDLIHSSFAVVSATPETAGYIFARARIKELEQEISYHLKESRASPEFRPFGLKDLDETY